MEYKMIYQGNKARLRKYILKKLFARFLKKYIRVFPRYDRVVICRFAGVCARGCPCSEKNAYVFKFVCNYGNNVRPLSGGVEQVNQSDSGE